MAPRLARQLTHPLALLLWRRGRVAWPTGSVADRAIVVVILLNARLRVRAGDPGRACGRGAARYLPPRRRHRDGGAGRSKRAELVPGDILVIEEGDRISADARLLTGVARGRISALTGESHRLPLARADDAGVPLLEARDLVFSGTT